MKPEHIKRLNEIAQDFGCFWGENPSPSALIRAICEGELVLFKAESLEAIESEKMIELRDRLLETQIKIAELSQALNKIH